MIRIITYGLLCCGLLCGAEIKLTSRGPYIQAARGVTWGTEGTGGIQNTYVYAPLAVKSHACFTLRNNNPSSAHTFNYEVRESPNPNVDVLAGAAAHWPNSFSESSLSVAASSTYQKCVASTQAAWMAVTISGTAGAAGSPDTADLYILEHPDTTTLSATVSASGGSGSGSSGTLPGTIIISQGGTLANSRTVSAANTAVAATIAAAANERARLYSVAARCSAGTASLTVADGGSTLFDIQAGGITTSTEFIDWLTPLTGTLNTAMTITLGACGAGNTGTLMVQASRF